MGRLAILLVAAPAVTLAGAWLFWVGGTLAGEHPLWGMTPGNIAEAAAFRDGAAIVRRVSNGEDPAAAGEVRAGFLSRESVTLTPMEAAARGSREEIVRLLLDLRATVDTATWTRAWCGTDAALVRAELAPVRPAGAKTECQ